MPGTMPKVKDSGQSLANQSEKQMRKPSAWATTGELLSRSLLNVRINEKAEQEAPEENDILTTETQPGVRTSLQSAVKLESQSQVKADSQPAVATYSHSGVFSHSSDEFVEFLTSATSRDVVDKVAKKRFEQIYLVRNELTKLRKSRVKLLQLLRDDVNINISTIASKASMQLSTIKQSSESVELGLDRYLLQASRLCVSLLAAEREVHALRVSQERRVTSRLESQTKRSFDLTLFALHLHDETQGDVQLTKLAKTHPQFMRCKKAAMENVKPGFFDETSGSLYKGIEVLDIFKIENKPMLNLFHHHTTSVGGGKVKGLFCKLDTQSIHRTAVFGFLTDEEIERQERRQESGTMFQRSWYSYSEEPHGFAEKRVRQSKQAVFPRNFSRYSTQEVDRNLVHEGNQKQKDNVHYLCLCRVLIGSHFVSSRGSAGFPDLSGVLRTGAAIPYDSMYNPDTEEYLMINTEYVLPEFFIQYRWEETAKQSVDALSRHAKLLLSSQPESLLQAFNPLDSAKDSWEKDVASNPRCTDVAVVDSVQWKLVQENGRSYRDQLFRSVTNAFRACVDVGNSNLDNSRKPKPVRMKSATRFQLTNQEHPKGGQSTASSEDGSDPDDSGCIMLERKVLEFKEELIRQKEKSKHLLDSKNNGYKTVT